MRAAPFIQWLHAGLLRAYPREVWQGAESEIFDVFQARLIAARGRGPAAVCGLVFREVTDSVRAGVRARLDSSDRVPGFDPRSPREKATSMLDGALLDLRSALRVFRSAPAFALAAVAILAIAIGANTAMFSVINAVMLRPLPFEDPGRLVALYETNPEQGWTQAQVAAANYLDWRERSRSFTDIAAHNDWLNEQTWVQDGAPRVLNVNETTGNFFSVLGVSFELGRGFDPEDDWSGGEAKIVLSHAGWTEHFGADPNILGTRIDLDGTTRTVVGVAAAGVDYPAPELDGWVPLSWDPANRTAVWFRRAHGMRAIGRLAPGVEAATARDELHGIADQLEAEFPETNVEMGVGFVSLQEWIAGDVSSPLLMVFGAVGLVLLIACANVANLQLARATDRRAELALRGALGAARGRLVRQSLLESLILAAVGGVIGLGLAAVTLRGLVTMLPADFPRIAEIGLDWRVLAFTFVAVVGTSLLFGVLPSLRSSRHEPAVDLQAQRVAGSRAGGRITAALVVLEVALVLPVAVGAVLMIRTLDEMRAVDPGFAVDNTTVLGVRLSRTQYPDGESRNAVFTALLNDLRQRSDLDGVALSRRLPFVNQSWSSDFRAESWGPDQYGVGVRHDEISRELFSTMNITMVEGRDFDAAELDTEPVAIVNRALAEQYFPEGDVLGQRICNSRNASDCRYWFRIVGVAENVRRVSLKAEEEPSIYGSWSQNGTSSGYLLIRSDLPAGDVTDIAAAALRNIDPEIPFHTVTTMSDVVAESAAQERLLLALLATFAAIAVALAAFGVYSVVAYATARRAREIGIRISLGARTADVFRSVTTRGMAPAVVGVAAGLGLTAALAGLIASFVYGVSARDPFSYGVVGFGLVALALVACLVPARRALRVDPVVVLRAE